MDNEEKPNPLLLGLISQKQQPNKTSPGEPEQANKKTVRNRKAPSWMSDYFINNNGPPEYSSINTIPRLPHSGSKRKATTNTIPTLPDPGLKTKATENLHSHQIPSPSKNKMVVEHLWCQICQISCSGITSLKQHLDGRQHKAKLEYGKLKKCDVCEIWCSDRDGLEMHFKGQKHKAKLKQVEVNGGERVLKSPIMCELCLVYCMNEDSYEMHLKGKKHATRTGNDGRVPSAIQSTNAIFTLLTIDVIC